MCLSLLVYQENFFPVFESLPPSFWVQIRQRDKHNTRTPLSKDPAGAIAYALYGRCFSNTARINSDCAIAYNDIHCARVRRRHVRMEGLARQTRCYCVESCGLPQDDHARPTNSTVWLDCAYRVNQCSRGQKRSHLLGPKLFVLSLMVKMLLPVACQLAYSWLHSSKTDDIMELLLLLMLQYR